MEKRQTDMLELETGPKVIKQSRVIGQPNESKSRGLTKTVLGGSA